MRQTEQYYRKPQNDFAPRFRTNQSTLNDEAEKRIVMLYTSGTSIDSIAREVGRARHRVVHILQTKGVFGNSPTECKDPKDETPIIVEEQIVEEQKEELTAREPETEIAVERPSRRRVRKPESSDKAAVQPASVPPVVEKPHNRWSDPVVDALCKIAIQSNIYPGKSLEEVRKLVSDSNR